MPDSMAKVQRTEIFVAIAKQHFVRCSAPKYRLFMVTVRCTLNELFNAFFYKYFGALHNVYRHQII
jgi:hypothetical protein